MARKFYIEKNRGLGCCSMMLWDALMIIALSVAYLPSVLNIHIVFCFLIGAAASILLFALMRIPVFGFILQIAAGLGWVVGLYILLDTKWIDNKGKGCMTTLWENDAVWWWTAVIAASAFFVFMHIVSAFDYHNKQKGDYTITEETETPVVVIQDNEIERYNKLIDQYNRYVDEIDTVQSFYSTKLSNMQLNSEIMYRIDCLLEQWNTNANAINDYIRAYEKSTVFGPKETAFQEMKKCVSTASQIIDELKVKYEQASICDNVSSDSTKTQASFFNGCDTLEKLNKRYKSLAKTYHPDTEVGDTETMQEINNEYEQLKKSMSDT